MMSRTRVTIAVAAAMSCLLAACGGGDSSNGPAELTPEQQVLAEAIKQRQYNFKDMGASFKTISDEVKAGRETSPEVSFTVRSLNAYARGMGEWFPEGSGPELGVETDSLATIWSDRAAFDAEVANFQTRVSELMSAKTAEAVQQSFRSVGASCKSCHDQFRKED